MNFNKLEEVSFSKSDIGYSKLLHTPVEAYTYHETEMYLVPLTMENYEDPLFSVAFPVIGTVVDLAVDNIDREDESFMKDIGKLEILPYRDGFFISIPCDNPNVICEELTKENLYLIPLKMGLRFAVCAVSEEKCKKAPKIIKDVLDKVKLSDSGLV